MQYNSPPLRMRHTPILKTQRSSSRHGLPTTKDTLKSMYKPHGRRLLCLFPQLTIAPSPTIHNILSQRFLCGRREPSATPIGPLKERHLVRNPPQVTRVAMEGFNYQVWSHCVKSLYNLPKIIMAKTRPPGVHGSPRLRQRNCKHKTKRARTSVINVCFERNWNIKN